MDTMNADTLVASKFEPCAEFAPAAGGSPICAGCGWLDTEHEGTSAEVHTLPGVPPRPVTPERLAS